MKLTELTQATSVAKTDLLLLDNADGTNSKSVSALDLANAFPDLFAKGTAPAAAVHNLFNRGKDITSLFDSGDFTTQVAANTFEDIFPGDYIKKSVTIDSTAYTATIKMVDLNAFYGYSNNAMVTTPHVAAIVLGLPNAVMNDTNTTDGGYKGSKMYTTTLPAYLEALQTAIGSDHILSHKIWISNAISTTAVSGGNPAWTGCATGAEWVDASISLMTEMQVYGSNVWSSSGFDTGEGCHQLAAFRNERHNKVLGNIYPWLRNVASSAYFAYVNLYGSAVYGVASGSAYVVPLILMK